MDSKVASSPFLETSVVGVVGDVKREHQNDFVCERCCVYGIDRREHEALTQVAEVRPRQFETEADRYVVHCSPWRAMRVLGEFGYTITVTPIDGRVIIGEGEKRTCIYTMIKTNSQN